MQAHILLSKKFELYPCFIPENAFIDAHVHVDVVWPCVAESEQEKRISGVGAGKRCGAGSDGEKVPIKQQAGSACDLEDVGGAAGQDAVGGFQFQLHFIVRRGAGQYEGGAYRVKAAVTWRDGECGRRAGDDAPGGQRLCTGHGAGGQVVAVFAGKGDGSAVAVHALHSHRDHGAAGAD